MAITAVPLFQSSVSSVEVTREAISPLLNREIKILCHAKDGTCFPVSVRVEEIFHAFKTLTAERTDNPFFTDVHLTGSSVAGIWSSEEASDIDIHAIADLREREETRKVAETYSVEWKLLQAILDVVTPYVPEPYRKGLARESAFKYEKIVNLLHSRSGGTLPYNTITLSFGSPPVELSVRCFCKSPESSDRDYDFNSGMLQLRASDDKYNLSSPYGDTNVIRSEIERKELTCNKPEELTRKGAVRYLAKVLLAGYNDKDTALFSTLMSVARIKEKGEEHPLTAPLFLKQIKEVFYEKEQGRACYIVALLHLWFMKQDGKGFKEIREEAKKELLSIFSSKETPLPLSDEIYLLISKGKKAELAWLLLSRCQTLKKVCYRGVDSLQLTLSSHLFTSNTKEAGISRNFYLPLPIDEGLTKFDESLVPHVFTGSILPKVSLGRCNEETLHTLSSLVESLFGSVQRFDFLCAFTQKFQLPPTESRAHLFFSWFSAMSSEEKKKVSLETISIALQGYGGAICLSKEEQAILLTIISNRLRSTESFTRWEEKILGSRAFSSLALEIFKGPSYQKLDETVQDFILNIVKVEIHKLLTATASDIKALFAKDPNGFKNRLLLAFQFYKDQKIISVSIAARAAQICIDCDLLEIANKFLFLFFTDKNTQNLQDVLSLAQGLAKRNLKDYIDLLSRVKGSQGREIHKKYVELGLYHALHDPTGDTAFAKTIITSSFSYFSEKERDLISFAVFFEASENPDLLPLFLLLATQWKLTANSFFPYLKAMDSSNLTLLEKLDGFRETLRSNVVFAHQFTQKAIELQMGTPAYEGLYILAETDPKTCIKLMSTVSSFGTEMIEESLALSVKIWEQILFHLPEDKKSSFNEPLLQYLAHVKNLLQLRAKNAKPSASLLESLRVLHKSSLFLTLDFDIWPIVWNLLKTNEHLLIGDWVALPSAPSEINLAAIESLIPLFIFDIESTLAWIKILLEQTKYPNEIATERIFQVLSCFAPIDKNVCNMPSKEASAIAAQVFERVSFCKTLPENLARRRLVQGAYFCMAFGDAVLRKKVLSLMESFPTFLTAVESNESFRLCSKQEIDIVFLAILRAWQFQNIDELIDLSNNHHVSSWINHGSSQLLFPEICKESASSMSSFIQSQEEVDNIKMGKVFFFFFNVMLYQKIWEMKLIVTNTSANPHIIKLKDELKKKIHENVFVAVDHCLRSIAKAKNLSFLRRFIVCSRGINTLFTEVERNKLFEMQIEIFSECLQSHLKNSKTEKEFELIAETCEHFCQPTEMVTNTPCILSAKAPEKKIQLLQEFVNVYIAYHSMEAAKSRYPISRFFFILASEVSKKELKDFYINWLKKITESSSPTTAEEYILLGELSGYCYTADECISGVEKRKDLLTQHRFISESFLFTNQKLLFSFLEKLLIDSQRFNAEDRSILTDHIHILMSSVYEIVQKKMLSYIERRNFHITISRLSSLYSESAFEPTYFFSCLAGVAYVGCFNLNDECGIRSGEDEVLCKRLPAIIASLASARKKLFEGISVIEKFSERVTKIEGIFAPIKEIYVRRHDSFTRYLTEAQIANIEAFFAVVA